ncbi:COG4 transport protein-domain-containing protein [Diplogelasinospora grovesii]|uniref:Conserved oligomeric Golgi complex subunit 4 n=1 Tax=Diplogelasinospora grovesii TaxID=303347 RepID=A0AAN6NED2_9PEZI|nr:COG4 transport protein-domain-containing protein [Diplogelasinospora grovesii]
MSAATLSNGAASPTISSSKLLPRSHIITSPDAPAMTSSSNLKTGNSIRKSSTTSKNINNNDNDDPSAFLRNASSPAEIRAALAGLHARESSLTGRLDSLMAAQHHQDLSRSLTRLDNLRAGLGAQVIAARGVSNVMLAGASDTAAHLSSRVRTLDLEKQRVEDTLRVVEQVAELKACVAGVVGSMGAPQDWEAAAGYIARAAKVPEDIVRGGFAAAVVPTVEVPDAPWVTLENARESLCSLFLREFERAASEGDEARITRFFKLFPLIGRGDVGLDVYGRYVCQGVAQEARTRLKEGVKKDDFFFANALAKLFEHIAEIVAGHGSLVERHYGRGKMVKVIERLQMEADVQGGIILDAWSDERAVDRKLTDIRSYPFSFLVQSFLPQQRGGFGGTPRVNSPAIGTGANSNDPRRSEDEGVDMKEIFGLLSEIAVMLGRWSLYSRFLAAKCKDPDTPDDAPLGMPDVLIKSNLSRKVEAKLAKPFDAMTMFFFRRSVEKAFQLEESPTGLSLSMSKPIDSNPPFIISAVDDVMYIVNILIRKSIETSQRDVVDSLISTITSLLGSDFIRMIQRKMQEELCPHPVQAGGFPPENKIIAFIVLINSLDMANEYLSRIISGFLPPAAAGTRAAEQQQSVNVLRDTFPFKNDLKEVIKHLQDLERSYSSKTRELLQDSRQVLFNQVIKPRLRPILTDTFRDADYTLTEEELSEMLAQSVDDIDESDYLELVHRRFEHGWDALMKPMARLMTPKTFTTVLDLTARSLSKTLEKRVWGYAGGKASAYGAIRMERDFNGIIGTISKGNYGVREMFAKITQILMVANMDEEEWEELEGENGGGEDGEGADGGMDWLLTEEERRRARTIVRT